MPERCKHRGAIPTGGFCRRDVPRVFRPRPAPTTAGRCGGPLTVPASTWRSVHARRIRAWRASGLLGSGGEIVDTAANGVELEISQHTAQAHVDRSKLAITPKRTRPCLTGCTSGVTIDPTALPETSSAICSRNRRSGDAARAVGDGPSGSLLFNREAEMGCLSVEFTPITALASGYGQKSWVARFRGAESAGASRATTSTTSDARL